MLGEYDTTKRAGPPTKSRSIYERYDTMGEFLPLRRRILPGEFLGACVSHYRRYSRSYNVDARYAIGPPSASKHEQRENRALASNPDRECPTAPAIHRNRLRLPPARRLSYCTRELRVGGALFSHLEEGARIWIPAPRGIFRDSPPGGFRSDGNYFATWPRFRNLGRMSTLGEFKNTIRNDILML